MARAVCASLLDADGIITDTYDYDAYGNLLARTGSTPNNYLYACQQWDPDLGVYYLRARYFNPQTGRFWTADDGKQGSQEDPQSLHLYAYCANNPVNLTDPSGEDYELGGMLSVMDISSVLFAQISPATTRAQATARRVLGAGRVSSRAFWAVYPDYDTFIASMVWDLVGGSIGDTYGKNPDSNQMSCATRVSYALNYVGGNEIPRLGDPASPNTPPRSQRNRKNVSYHGREGDNKYYITGAGDMKEYLLRKWGKEDAKIGDVPKLNQFTAGLGAGQIAVFATPGPRGRGHAGVLKQGYQDPYVEGELPVWVWALSTP